jgi:uncharacterized protein YhfF
MERSLMNKKMDFWGRDKYDERLLEEVLRGLKTATCTPKVWYDPLPEEEKSNIGDLFDIYTKAGEHRCTIEITDIYEIAFGDIKSEAGARIASGENSTLEEYIKDHIFTWKEPLESEGHAFNANTIIIVEHFKLVSPTIEVVDFHPVTMTDAEASIFANWFDGPEVTEVLEPETRKNTYFSVFREKELVGFISIKEKKIDVFIKPEMQEENLEIMLREKAIEYSKTIKKAFFS